jgi:hypothetical protein
MSIDEQSPAPPQPAPWLPHGQGEQPLPDAGPGSVAPHTARRLRRWGVSAGVTAFAVLIAGGGTAFAADAYAAHRVCATMKLASSTTAADPITLKQVRDQILGVDQLLFLHPSLRKSVRDLSSDIGQLQDVKLLTEGEEPDPSALGDMFTVSTAVDDDAQAAMTQCDLPARGITATTD